MNIGGILSGSALTQVLGLAGGPFGFIATQIAQQLMSSIVHSVLDDIGLPPALRDTLGNVADNMFGQPLAGSTNYHGLIDQLADSVGANFLERGAMHQQAQDVYDNLSNFILQQMDEQRESETGERGEGVNRSGADGWIRAMAKAMGKMLDEAWHEAEQLANNINKEDPSTTAEYQGAVQEFNFIMQAFSTAIKAAGEGASAMARKQ